MEYILGKVGITTAGAYDSSKAYEKLSCVLHNGISWVSTKDVPVGYAPAEGSTYWQKMSERGEQGPQGERGPQGNSAFDGNGVEIVNNLTQGGESAVLSAEQGKILKNDLAELSENQSKVYKTEEKTFPQLYQGTIDPSTGAEGNATNRIRTDFIAVDDIIGFGVPNANYKFFVRHYDSQYNYLGYKSNLSPNYYNEYEKSELLTGNFTNGASASETAFIRVVLRTQPDAAITPSIAQEVLFFYMARDVYEPINFAVVPSVIEDTFALSHPLNWEYGALFTATGLITPSTVKSEFFKKFRSKKFLKAQRMKIAITGGTFAIFEYDAEYNFLRSVAESNYYPAQDCRYVKIAGDISSAADFSVSIYTDTYEEVKNANKQDCISFIYQTFPSQGRSVDESDASITQYSEEQYCNSGLLRLPPNYDPQGKPTRLVLWAHGSAWYGRFGTIDFNSDYLPYLQYLQNEGYAIFDCFGWSSKYNDSTPISTMGTPTNMSCIFDAYRWVVENYNIATDGIYVTGKSLGGIICGNMMHQHSVPVIACSPLAPLFDSRVIQFGYDALTRQYYCEDMGFKNYDGIIGTSQSSPMDNEAFLSLLSDNADRLIGYTLLSGVLDAKEAATIISNAADFANLTKICNVPLKIWQAKDDKSVQYACNDNFCKAIRNAGGYAEMRRMPDNTGGHHAVDTSPSALRANVTTILGIECTDIPVAYIEMVNWWRTL